MSFERLGAPVALGDRRVLHPGMLRWLRALGWMVLIGFLSVLSFGVPYSILDHFLPEAGWIEVASNAVCAVIALGVYAALVWFGEARAPAELALKAALPGLLAGLLIGFLMFASVMGIMAV